METKLDEIPAHEPAPGEIETFELIQALSENGGQIISGNEWVNTPEGGHFLIKVKTDWLYVFKSRMPLPFIIGPDGPVR